MPWIYLLIAAAFEVAFAIGLKASDGFTRPWPAAVATVGIIGGVGFLALALRGLPVSAGYAAWTGLGTAGAVVAGWLLFNEIVPPARLLGLALILAGVLLVKSGST